MDRLIYTAMTGASQSLDQQAVVANNLANASTTGFRAQLATYRAVPMNFGDGSNVDPTTTRTYVLASTPGADYAPGPITRTGNPLDVAVQGAGWLAVQAADGSEGTRAPATCTSTRTASSSTRATCRWSATAARSRCRRTRK